METWREINAYPNYEVSDMGRVRNVTTGHVLKPMRNHRGYDKVELKSKGQFIHRLVATAFIREPLENEQVNHKDGNKTNNCVDNLEWCLQSQNSQHSYDTGLQKRQFGKDNHYSRQVEQYTREGKFIKLWDSIADFEREAGIRVGKSHVSEVCKGRRPIAHGYSWKYPSEEVNAPSWDN